MTMAQTPPPAPLVLVAASTLSGAGTQASPFVIMNGDDIYEGTTVAMLSATGGSGAAGFSYAVAGTVFGAASTTDGNPRNMTIAVDSLTLETAYPVTVMVTRDSETVTATVYVSVVAQADLVNPLSLTIRVSGSRTDVSMLPGLASVVFLLEDSSAQVGEQILELEPTGGTRANDVWTVSDVRGTVNFRVDVENNGAMNFLANVAQVFRAEPDYPVTITLRNGAQEVSMTFIVRPPGGLSTFRDGMPVVPREVVVRTAFVSLPPKAFESDKAIFYSSDN